MTVVVKMVGRGKVENVSPPSTKQTHTGSTFNSLKT